MINKLPLLTKELEDKYNNIPIILEINSIITNHKKGRSGVEGLSKIPTLKFGRAEIHAIDNCEPNLWRILGTFCSWVLSQEDSILEIVE